MSLVWIIYFIDVLSPGDGTWIFLSLLGAGIVFCSAFYFVGKADNDKSVANAAKTPLTILSVLFVLVFLYNWLMPSKDTSYKMLAAYGVERIAENPDVKRLAGKSLDVLEKAMDSYINKDKAKQE